MTEMPTPDLYPLAGGRPRAERPWPRRRTAASLDQSLLGPSRNSRSQHTAGNTTEERKRTVLLHAQRQKNPARLRARVLIALSCSTGWGVLFDFGFQFHATALFSLIQTWLGITMCPSLKELCSRPASLEDRLTLQSRSFRDPSTVCFARRRPCLREFVCIQGFYGRGSY